MRTLRGDFLCAPFEVPFLVYGKNVSREFWNCKLLEFGEECARCREKCLLPFLRTARRCSSSGAFSDFQELCVSVFLEKCLRLLLRAGLVLREASYCHPK